MTKNYPEKQRAKKTAKTEVATVTDEMTAVLEEIIEEPVKPKKGELITPINETDFLIGAREYKLVANYREGFDSAKLGERFSEVLARYDYVVGDWGYEQLRLKGFFETSNRRALPEQRIDTLEDYLYEFCNFGCAYFVIQRIGGKRDKNQNRRRRNKPTNQGKNTQDAHISEKREELVSRKKNKPVIKQRQIAQEKSEPQTEVKTPSFTIRKREE
ncbi:MAG: YutD family protein [Enterococcus sp.]